MARLLSFTFAAALCAVAFVPRVAAQASCVDTTGQMCLNALRTLGGDGAVVDDIFQTSDGLYGPQLHFGQYIRGVNGCIGGTGFNDCGMGGPPYDTCRTVYGGYVCCSPSDATCNPPGGRDPTFQANSLDWYWTQVTRTDGAGNPVADGNSDMSTYAPSRGRLYDLGGEANRVVVFPITDHDPLPCEAFEYSLWLSNNPDATEIADPGAPDPNKWNPATMIRAFQQGWTRNIHAQGAADAGRSDLSTYLRDTTDGDAIADALVTVWALPCGLTFRYVAMEGGNYGNPGPECTFHSSEDELDAVAGLNEDDTAICVDADGDGHRDIACGGDDCDDSNAMRHPGAFEPCDATMDLNCLPMADCPSGTVCDGTSGLCVPQCFEGGCADGFTCVDTRCVDSACAARTDACPAGTLCRGGDCVGPCDGVVCPDGQQCQEGACIDPCLGVVCPTNQVCVARDSSALTLCGPSCACTELAVPICPTGTACDSRDGTPTAGMCVDPGCDTATCTDGQVCRGGSCVDACDGVMCPRAQTCVSGQCVPDLCASVVCPAGQVCSDGTCIDACTGVTCPDGQICQNGGCVADPCFGVDCPAGKVCQNGTCVAGGTPVDAGGSGFDGGAAQHDAGSTGATMAGGCGCRASGGRSNAGLGLMALLGLAIVWRRRR